MAQVDRRVVVEHFTNTRCGICASRNPAFNVNMANHPEVLRLTIHPSRPYSSCELHKHNSADNDARTNFYDILGGTPRLVIQGDVVSSGANYGSAAIFDAYEETTTPYDIKVEMLKRTSDSLTARVVIRKVADDARSSLFLYTPAVEDTLQFNAPNGEKEHYNVLRKILFNNSIVAPVNIEDSLEVMVRTEMHSDWVSNNMTVIAIAQDEGSKEILQAANSSDNPSVEEEDETSSVSTKRITEGISVYPNPSMGIYTISGTGITNADLKLRDVNGSIILSTSFMNNDTINLSQFSNGVYFLSIVTKDSVITKRLVKR